MLMVRADGLKRLNAEEQLGQSFTSGTEFLSYKMGLKDKLEKPVRKPIVNRTFLKFSAWTALFIVIKNFTKIRGPLTGSLHEGQEAVSPSAKLEGQ